MSREKGLLDALRIADGFLSASDTKYAVVGAIAVGVRSEPRFTRDVDLALAVESDQEAEELLGFLIRSGYTIHELFQHDVTQDIVTARLVHPDIPDVLTDFLFQTSGIEKEVVDRAETIHVSPELPVRVAQTGHLIAMKLLSRQQDRPQDQIDLVHLLKTATKHDLELAQAGIAAIKERKGRDLSADLREQQRKFWPG